MIEPGWGGGKRLIKLSLIKFCRKLAFPSVTKVTISGARTTSCGCSSENCQLMGANVINPILTNAFLLPFGFNNRIFPFTSFSDTEHIRIRGGWGQFKKFSDNPKVYHLILCSETCT